MKIYLILWPWAQGCHHYLANLSSWGKSTKGTTDKEANTTSLRGSGPNNTPNTEFWWIGWKHTVPEIPRSLFHVKLYPLYCPAQLTWAIQSTYAVAWLSHAQMVPAFRGIMSENSLNDLVPQCKAMMETVFEPPKLQSYLLPFVEVKG